MQDKISTQLTVDWPRILIRPCMLMFNGSVFTEMNFSIHGKELISTLYSYIWDVLFEEALTLEV